MLRLSRPAGGFTPASSAHVDIKSPKYPTCADTVPALILPGHRARNGTRMPPSVSARLIPVNEPLAEKKVGS